VKDGSGFLNSIITVQRSYRRFWQSLFAKMLIQPLIKKAMTITGLSDPKKLCVVVMGGSSGLGYPLNVS